MAPVDGGIEVGVLEAGGITMELEAGIEAESPLLGTTELGGARGEAPGEEHLRGCEAALAWESFLAPMGRAGPLLVLSSVIPLILSISATLRRAGKSSWDTETSPLYM